LVRGSIPLGSRRRPPQKSGGLFCSWALSQTRPSL
jgi:hypothetical protein